MKSKIWLSLCLLLMTGTLFASSVYTVSLGGDDDDGIYLMQIDENGNVLKAPKLIATEDQLGGDCDCPTAIVPLGADQLSVWTVNENSQFFRVNVDRNTFKTISVKRITQFTTTDNDVISSSQNPAAPFLASETGNAVARAYGLTTSGAPSGINWRLIPRIDGGNDEA